MKSIHVPSLHNSSVKIAFMFHGNPNVPRFFRHLERLFRLDSYYVPAHIPFIAHFGLQDVNIRFRRFELL